MLQAARELNLTVRRGRDLARITAVTGTDERADGTVLAVLMQQGLASELKLDTARDRRGQPTPRQGGGPEQLR